MNVSEKVFYFIMISLCIAAVSLTISKSQIFSPFRRWVEKRSRILGVLLNCTYCTSHWAAIFFVVLLYIYSPVVMVTNILFLDAVITIFATVCLATIIVGIIFRESL